MKTILYNTTTDQLIGKARKGHYIVDGLQPELPENIVELELVYTDMPVYDNIRQKLQENWFRAGAFWVQEWVIIDRTAEETEAVLEILDSKINPITIKKLLQKVIEPDLSEDADLTQEMIDAALQIYPHYRWGIAYATGDRFNKDGNLYEVIQAHTSQEDWIPENLPALYKKFTPSNVIADWVQPLGAHDAYQIGDKVKHKSSIWVNEVDNNIWEPGVSGWVEL